MTNVYDSHLRISYGSLKFPHNILVWEAMRLQCFPPMRYVKNGEYPWCTLFRNFLKIAVYVCLLCMALLCILGVLCGFLDNLFSI